MFFSKAEGVSDPAYTSSIRSMNYKSRVLSFFQLTFTAACFTSFFIALQTTTNILPQKFSASRKFETRSIWENTCIDFKILIVKSMIRFFFSWNEHAWQDFALASACPACAPIYLVDARTTSNLPGGVLVYISCVGPRLPATGGDTAVWAIPLVWSRPHATFWQRWPL